LLPLGEYEIVPRNERAFDSPVPSPAAATSGGPKPILKKRPSLGDYADMDDDMKAKSITWKLTGYMARKPVSSFSCCCGFIIVLVVIVVASGLAGITTPSTYDWTIASTEESKNLDAYDDATDQVDLPANLQGTRRERANMADVWYLYKSDDGTEIFTPARLQEICVIERILIANEDFMNFCKIRPEVDDWEPLGVDSCEIPDSSVVQIFYNFTLPSDFIADDGCRLLSDAEVRAKADELYAAVETEEGIAAFGYLLDKDTLERGYSTRTQSQWYLGGPLEGYNTQLDDSSDQFADYQNFLAADDGSVGGVEKELFEYFDIDSNEDNFFPYYPSPYRSDVEEEGMEILWTSIPMRENEFVRLVEADLFFSIFSIIFVFGWIRFHLGNTFMAIIGILQIVASIPLTLLVYRGIYQIPFFQQLHALTLFIILGVGADDIFVFVDGWKQGAPPADTPPPEDEEAATEAIHERLYRTYVHTREAVFNTSFTTAFAFIATGASPLMPISTFGYFAATCIVINYVLVMTLTPPTVIVAEKHFGMAWPCCKKTGADVESSEGSAESDEDEETIVDKYYIPLMKSEIKGVPVFSVTCIVTLFAVAIFLLTRGLMLEPPEEQEQWFPPDHIMQRAENSAVDDYISGGEDTYTHIDVTIGVSGIDRGNFNVYIPADNRGDAEFDENFNFYEEQCQRMLLRACDDIQTFSCTEDGCAPLTTLARPDTTECFIGHFHQWLADEGITTDPYSLSEADFYAQLTTFRETQTKEDGESWAYDIGIIDGVLKFVSFSFTSSMEMLAPYDEKGPVLDRMEDFLDHVKSYEECDVCSCGSIMQTSGIWTWYRSEEGLLIGFYNGLAISFPVAFIVLLFSTGNILLALYAIMTVFFIVFGVLGFVQLLGWPIGVSESVAGIIIVGFSVDYTVHLGHMYMQGDKHDFFERAARFEYASKTMVATVVAGAVTTLGAGVFLFPAQLIFFVKMAILICTTIILSWIYSLFFFMGLLYVAGPQYDSFKVMPAFKWCYEKIKGDKAD